MSAVATAVVAGAAISSQASKNAANTQANAANNAAGMTQAQFNTINQQQAPYREAGYGGLNKLSYLLGIGDPNRGGGYGGSVNWQGVASDPAMQAFFKSSGWTPTAWTAAAQDSLTQNFGGDVNKWLAAQNSLLKPLGTQLDGSQYISGVQQNNPYAGAASAGIPGAGSMQSIGSPQSADNSGGYGSLLHQFNASDLNANLAPSYQFMLDQGRGALENAATRGGGLLAGNTLQGLNKFTQDYASTGYQQAYNNFNNNQNNIYNRLAGIAGIGQGANTLTANAGTTAAQNAGNYLVGGANAQAAGQVGSANAINSGLSNAAGWGYLNSRPVSGYPASSTGGGSNAAGGIRFASPSAFD